MGALESIEHVVVLMLENRSFDCMLGKLYPKDPSFEGLSGNERNLWLTQPIPVWSSSSVPLDAGAACIPDPDPGELFSDMNGQLFNGPRSAVPPQMTGFVADYMAQQPQPPDCRAPMHYFTPDQVPVISTLARAFGVCDQWFASAPCQTWPNRFFAHTGTALGYVNNANFPHLFPGPSIFRRLSDCKRSWRVYFHDVPQSVMIGDILIEAPLHYRLFSTFLSDAHNGALPNYSFIEPRYFTDLFLNNTPNDEHPPHDIRYGEALMGAVYNAVRSSPCWKKTLLLITYDEHGGCFDHVSPPSAVAPDDHAQDGFGFNSYGVRVPAVLISPYVPPGSKVRVAPAGLPTAGPPYPFDHTSIIKTLRILFGLGASLTARDDAAPDLIAPLSLNQPTNDGPSQVLGPVPPPDVVTLQKRASAKPNQMQAALAQMTDQLPTAPMSADDAVPAPRPLSGRVPATVAQAHARSVVQIRSFLGI